MKQFLAFLLLLIVAVANGAPCADDCCQDERAATGQGIPKKQDADCACSPFSVCAGCHAFTTPAPPVLEPVGPADGPIGHTESYKGLVPTPSHATPWQPPRVSGSL